MLNVVLRGDLKMKQTDHNYICSYQCKIYATIWKYLPFTVALCALSKSGVFVSHRWYRSSRKGVLIIKRKYGMVGVAPRG